MRNPLKNITFLGNVDFFPYISSNKHFKQKNMRKTMGKLFLMLAVFLSASIGVFAQETTSEIQGKVSDDKAGLAGVVITAIHQPTGTKYVTTTRKDGRYNISAVRIGGPYSITTTYVGYKTEKQDGVFLTLGQAYEGNFSVKPIIKDLGSVTVTTNKQNKVFNNNHTGSQEIITKDQLEKLPTINRSIQDFTKLEPTANGSSFGGRSSQYNNITVDGANFNNGFGLSATLGGQANAQPISLDAIEQIQVNVSPYDVKQGGFTGAGINTVTKSGTNKLQGSVYEYTRGTNTQGYNVGNVTVTKSPFDFYQKGATLGGPIIKNKLFFFGSYEEVQQTSPAYTMVASTASNPASAGLVSQVNADTLNVLKEFLKTKFGYDPGNYQNYSFVTASKKATIKIDWNINSKNTFTLKYNYLRSYSEQPQSTSRTGSGFVKGPAYQNFTYGLPFDGSKYLINNNFDIWIGELNTRFNSSLSNKLQVGYTRERDPRSPGVPGASPLPMVDILNGTGNTYGTQVATSFGYETYTYNNLINSDVYQASDVVSYYKGAHEFTFGTQNYYRKYTDAFAPNYAGGYQFPSFQAFYTAANGGPAVDKYFQEWSNIPGGPFPFYSASSTELSAFVQDKVKATHNFTLTYGLRYDKTIYQQIFLDNPYFDALQFANGQSYNIGKAPGNASVLSPRLGFNWDILNDRTLQLRGGYGIFQGPPPFVWLANQPGNNGVLIASGNYTNVPFTQNAITTPPAGVNTTPPTTTQSATSYGAAVTTPNFKYPTVSKMSVALDKKFNNGWVVTLEYSYSKDINAVYFSNLNLNESNAYAMDGADNRLRYLTVTNSNKYYYGSTQANPNLSSAILMSNINKGYAATTTLRVQKNYKDGFFSLAYSYMEAYNVATGGSTASSLWSGRPVGNADPNAPNLSYADYYLPHRIIGYLSQDISKSKYHTTSIGIIYEGAASGVGSYTYGGDLNGDGNSGNDLMYVPRNASEINLVKVGSGGLGTGTSTDPRTSTQIWNQLNNFISQDSYLNSHRGQYVQANAVVFPWFNKFDVNFKQDFYYVTKKNVKNTIRVTADILNVGNLLNQNWGTFKQQTTSTPLTFEGMNGNKPSFSFPYLDATNQVPLVNSYTNNNSIISRWQLQIGLKYLFN